MTAAMTPGREEAGRRHATVMIHVDALRHDYITEEDMPFLHRLSKQGIQVRLIPPFGFEPDGAYLTGTNPEDYEGGTHFVLAENGPRIPASRWIPGSLDYLNKYLQYPIRKAISKVIAARGETLRVRSNPFIGFIPFRLLRYFDFNDKHLSYEPEFSERASTIFDYLRAHQLSFLYHGAPAFSVRARDVADRVLADASGEIAFYFLFIGDLDGMGHQYGPDSEERKACARQVDQCLERVWAKLHALHDGVDFIAFGDHGMVSVMRYLDFGPVIKSLPLKVGRDYVYFLDSTFARFWPFNEKARRILREVLARVPGGKLVDDDEQESYKIRFRNNKFGELIFWVDGDAMIFPSFWHVRSKKKGMHGYRREVKDNHAAALIHSTRRRLQTDQATCTMHDLFQTTMASLGLSPDADTLGVSLSNDVHAPK